jgi:hypothetical protein
VEQYKRRTAGSWAGIHNVSAATIGKLYHAAVRKAANGGDIGQRERRERRHQSQRTKKPVDHAVWIGET